MTSELTEVLRKDFYDRLTNLYRLSDDEIKAAGLGFLIPEPAEPSEPEEPPKKTFRIHVVETWGGYFEVEAADEEEAYDCAADLEYNSDELSCEDRHYFVCK